MARLSGSISTLGVSKDESKTNLCPLLAESSRWHPPIFGVASVRYTPIPATIVKIGPALEAGGKCGLV